MHTGPVFKGFDAVLGSEVPGNMTLAGGIFDQVDVSGTGRDMHAARNLDFRIAGQRDHELPGRAGVPFLGIERRGGLVAWRRAKLRAAGRH